MALHACLEAGSWASGCKHVTHWASGMLRSSDVGDRQAGQRWGPCSAVGHWDRSQCTLRCFQVQQMGTGAFNPGGKVICLYSHPVLSFCRRQGTVALGSQLALQKPCVCPLDLAARCPWASSNFRHVCSVPHHVRLLVTPRTVTHQAPLSMAFSREEY